MSVAAMQNHWAALSAARGIDVTYTRDGIDHPMRLVPGRHDTDLDNTDGAYAEDLETEWIALAKDFVDEGLDRPQRRDVITYTDPNGTAVKLAVGPNFGNASWRWSDHYRIMFRIFAQERPT